MKTNELTGVALDWAVANCEGLLHDDGTVSDYWQPSELWEQGGPIIEREKICIGYSYVSATKSLRPFATRAKSLDEAGDCTQYGPTPLIAAMRCYVASKLGDEVDVPEELR